LRVVYFGTPEFAVAPLEVLLKSRHEIIAVATQPDRQSGRGRKVHACPVKEAALKAGIRVLQPEKAAGTEFINDLKTLDPSVIVVTAYGQILPPEILRLPEYGCINIHASLLPKYRGSSPISRAIIDGENKTGITTMFMDEGMDTGPVLMREELQINPDDTAGTLSDRLSGLGAQLILKTLDELEKGNINPVPQSGKPSYAPLMKKSDGLIDWTKSAAELLNFIRGMNPWPGAYTFLNGERVKILSVKVLDETGEAGTVTKSSKDELVIGTGKGSISVLEIQPPGKKVMNIKAFLQGKKPPAGVRFMHHE
jgi:methionyl-tRNA formyltransferase